MSERESVRYIELKCERDIERKRERELSKRASILLYKYKKRERQTEILR